MKKQIVVIGLGRFGVNVATTLYGMGHDVLALDKEEKNVLNVASQLTRAIQADATDEAIIKELGLADFDVAIVAIGEAIESSVLITILLKKLGVRYIVARADSELHGSILEKIGADKVVYPERDTASRIAHILTLTDVMDYIPVGDGYGIAKFKAPSYLVGRTLGDIGFGPGGKRDVAVLLLQRGKEAIVNPSQDEVVSLVDVLSVAGSDNRIEALLAEAEKSKKK
jgi:trk system potassium uptake protein TrkA